MKMALENENEMSAKTVVMRKQLEDVGFRFEPSFNECVDIVRRSAAMDGQFLTFEETAY